MRDTIDLAAGYCIPALHGFSSARGRVHPAA